MKHVAVMVRKDLRENWVLLVVAIAIPLLMIALTSLRTEGTARIASYAGSTTAVESGEVDALIDDANRVVYVQSLSPVLSEELTQRARSARSGEVRVHGEGASSRLFAGFLLTILFWVMTAITQPILMLAERKDGLHHALMLTHLTYNQYQLAKVLVAFVSNVALLGVLTVLLGAQLTAAGVGMTLLLSALSVTLSLLLAAFLATEERLIVVNTPLSVVVVFAEVYLFLAQHGDRSPIQEVARGIVAGSPPGVVAPAVVLVASVACYAWAYRRTRREGRS